MGSYKQLMKLFVAGLPYDFDDTDLKEMFELYGEVSSAKVAIDRETRKSRGFGFLEMAVALEAKEAIDALHGARLRGGKELVVREAEEKPRDSRDNRNPVDSDPGAELFLSPEKYPVSAILHFSRPCPGAHTLRLYESADPLYGWIFLKVKMQLYFQSLQWSSFAFQAGILETISFNRFLLSGNFSIQLAYCGVQHSATTMAFTLI